MAGNASSFDYQECKSHVFGEPKDPICKLVLGYTHSPPRRPYRSMTTYAITIQAITI